MPPTTDEAMDFDKTGGSSHQRPSPKVGSPTPDGVNESSQRPSTEPRNAREPGNVPEINYGHSQKREGQGTPQAVPHRVTTPELEGLTFPGNYLEARDNPYDVLLYQDPHYRHRSEVVGRKTKTTPRTSGTAGIDVPPSPIRAGHGYGEGDRDSAPPSQNEVGSARQLHEECSSRIGERTADQGGCLAEREGQDGGKGEEGTSKDIAGSPYNKEA